MATSALGASDTKQSCQELRQLLLNCGIASFLSVLATFTATIVALNWTQFNVSVLTETDARHFYFAANGQTAPNGKSPE